MLKRIITLIIFAGVLFSLFSICVSAFELDDSKAKPDAYYLYNFENDTVMVAYNTDKVISASSTVKIMTACIALESGVANNKIVTITDAMLKGVSGRFMGLTSGDKMTFEDLLYSMICSSFNDATHAIAFTVSGSLDGYLNKMNEKAQEIGMIDTYYADITGISDASKTTLNDLIKLVKYVSQNEDFLKITSTKSYQLSVFATCEYNRINNRSSLLSSYRGLHNFNVGSSNNGESAVSYYNNGKLSFVCIVMNAKAKDDDETNYAEQYTKELLNHGLYDYSSKTLLSKDTVIDSLPVKYSTSGEEVGLYLQSDIYQYLPKDSSTDGEYSYTYYLYDKELKAPLKSGEEIGVLIVSRNGRYVASEKIIVKKTVGRNEFLYFMDILKNYVTSRAFFISLISVIVISVVYYLYKQELLNKMYRRRIKNKKR